MATGSFLDKSLHELYHFAQLENIGVHISRKKIVVTQIDVD